MSSPSALPTATTTPSTYLQPHTVSMNASTSEVLVTKRQRLLSNENDLSAATSGDNVFAATIPPQPQAKTAVNGKEPSAWPTMAPPVSRDPLATSTTKTTTPTTTTPTTATTVAVQKRSTRTIKRELARLSDVSFAGTLKAVHSKRRGALTISTPVVTDSRRLRSAFNVPVVDEGGLKSRGSSNSKKQHVAMKNTSTLAPGAGRARSSVATPKKQGKATKRRIAVDPALHGSTLVATKKAAVGLVTATAAATVGTSMVPSITPSSTKSAFLSEEAVKTVPLKTAVAGQEAVGSGLIEAGGSETVVKLGLLGNGFYFVINGNKATTSSTFDYPATEGGGIQSGLAVLPVSLNNVSNVAEPKQIKAVGSSVPYTKDSAPMKENPKSLNSSAALNDSLNGSIQARKFKVAPADSSGKNEADLQHNPTKLKTGAPVITVTTAAIFKAPLPPKMDCMFQPIVPKENKVATVELTATDHTVALRLAAAATATTTPTTLAASVTPDPILDFRSPLVHHTIISEQEMATFIQETLMSTARDDGVLGDGAAACQEPSVKHEHMPDLWGTPERVLIDRQTTNGGAHGDVLFSGRLDTMSWEGGSPAGGDFDVDEFLSKGGTAEVG